MNKMHFVLFANCFPVKGYTRSIICDTTRYKYDFIPNSLYEFLKTYNKKKISDIKKDFNEDDWKIVETYLDFLESKDYIFYTETPELFPDVEIKYENPLLITNAVIDFDEKSQHDLSKIFSELNELRCESIEIRIYKPIAFSKIEEVLGFTKESSFRSVYLIICFHKDYNVSLIGELIKNNRRIMSITIHSIPNDVNLWSESNILPNVFLIKNSINNEECCGAISKYNFTSNINLFMESHLFNNCLNKKISIDKYGYIKNCPSAQESFGHHSNTQIKDVIKKPGFKKFWKISKDDIEKCKDCEFRYICVDCRIYIEEPQNILSKPKKCNYDPYSGHWNTNNY